MPQLTSLLAGTFVIVLAWDVYVAPRAFESGLEIALAERGIALGSESTGSFRKAAAPQTIVDRSRKGDRLAQSRPSDAAPRVIANVELGPGAAVLLRDREGDTLFGVDPAAGLTIVAKDVVLPQLTILNSASRPARGLAAPDAVPVPAPRTPQETPVMTGRKPEAKRPAGCDPSFSPIAAPQLGHIFGRCVTDVAGPTRLARVQ